MRSLITGIVILVCAVGIFGMVCTVFRLAGPAPATRVDKQQAQTKWWQSTFPPAVAILSHSVHFDRGTVLGGDKCGNFEAALENDGGVTLFGWACDPRDFRPAPSVLVRDNGRDLKVVSVYRKRGDVMAFLGKRSALKSGWFLWLPAGEVAPGTHRFEAYAALSNGKLCELWAKPVIVKPTPAP